MRKIVLVSTVFFLVGIYMFPIVWIYIAAFKTRGDLFAMPPKMVFHPSYVNFHSVFIVKGFSKALSNSIVVALLSTTTALFISIFSGYTLSRNKSKLTTNIYFFIFSILVMPPIVTLLPVYILFTKVNLIGSIWGLVLLHVAMLCPFGTILLKNFFDEIPLRCEEVASIEQIPFRYYLTKIFIREAKIPIATCGFFLFLMSWNEFLYSMIITSNNSITLPVSTLGLVTPIGTFWGEIAAIAVVCTLPVLILVILLRKHLISGFSYGIVLNN